MSVENLPDVAIAGRQTTAGAAEETLNIGLNGGAPAPSILIPRPQKMQITDIVCSSRQEAIFQVQINRGSGFVTEFNSIVGASGNSGGIDLGSPLVIKGGPSVAVRVLVETPGGAALVAVSMLGVTGGNS